MQIICSLVANYAREKYTHTFNPKSNSHFTIAVKSFGFASSIRRYSCLETWFAKLTSGHCHGAHAPWQSFDNLMGYKIASSASGLLDLKNFTFGFARAILISSCFFSSRLNTRISFISGNYSGG